MACMSEPEPSAALDADAQRVLAALRPRRRARPRLAEPLRDARDEAVATPFGPVIAWRLDPWGGSPTTPATLLVHGWEDDNALWGPMIEACLAVGRPVVVFDLPGHGFSPAERCSIGSAAAAVRAVAEAMGPIDSAVGHSFGCVAITRALGDGLAARRAVLIATPMPTAKAGGSHWDRAQEALGVGDAAMERAKAMFEDEERIFPPFDYPALAASMTAKALFIHSLDDEGCPPENSRILADAWGGGTGPGAALTWVDGLGHRLVAQDEATLAGVVDFLERA